MSDNTRSDDTATTFADLMLLLLLTVLAVFAMQSETSREVQVGVDLDRQVTVRAGPDVAYEVKVGGIIIVRVDGSLRARHGSHERDTVDVMWTLGRDVSSGESTLNLFVSSQVSSVDIDIKVTKECPGKTVKVEWGPPLDDWVAEEVRLHVSKQGIQRRIRDDGEDRPEDQ